MRPANPMTAFAELDAQNLGSVWWSRPRASGPRPLSTLRCSDMSEKCGEKRLGSHVRGAPSTEPESKAAPTREFRLLASVAAGDALAPFVPERAPRPSSCARLWTPPASLSGTRFRPGSGSGSGAAESALLLNRLQRFPAPNRLTEIIPLISGNCSSGAELATARPSEVDAAIGVSHGVHATATGAHKLQLLLRPSGRRRAS